MVFKGRNHQTLVTPHQVVVLGSVMGVVLFLIFINFCESFVRTSNYGMLIVLLRINECSRALKNVVNFEITLSALAQRCIYILRQFGSFTKIDPVF